MSDDFEKEIRKLAEKSQARPKRAAKPDDLNRENQDDFTAVLDEFLKIANEGVKIYNESVNENRLTIYELPGDFLEIFLGIQGRRGGLAIVSPERLAVFFDEDPDVITVIGKLRNSNSGMQVNMNKSLQLIKISFSKADRGYEYKDNTGKPLNSGGIIAVLMGWLVSA
jgi:hypothetical protein